MDGDATIDSRYRRPSLKARSTKSSQNARSRNSKCDGTGGPCSPFSMCASPFSTRHGPALSGGSIQTSNQTMDIIHYGSQREEPHDLACSHRSPDARQYFFPLSRPAKGWLTANSRALATFLDVDAAAAAQRRHLTARQAETLARLAAVKTARDAALLASLQRAGRPPGSGGARSVFGYRPLGLALAEHPFEGNRG